MKKPKVSREEKMSLIQEKLETGVREIFESEKYREYIRTMAKFPNYSINNCILIASQRPDASYVCGYKTWQTEFNRTVNRNESGIMIIAPVVAIRKIPKDKYTLGIFESIEVSIQMLLGYSKPCSVNKNS